MHSARQVSRQGCGAATISAWGCKFTEPSPPRPPWIMRVGVALNSTTAAACMPRADGTEPPHSGFLQQYCGPPSALISSIMRRSDLKPASSAPPNM
eukprot:scaffold32519_cov27-Tisochrysis_lutea.AAC.2